MNFTENEIFEAFIPWATEACERKGQLPSPGNLRTELGDCLLLIRFPIMIFDEFLIYMAKYPALLERDVVFDIIRHIRSKTPLTSAVHFNMNPRLRTQRASFMKKKSIRFRYRETLDKSSVSFTANKDVWLSSCGIAMLNTEGSEFLL